MDHSRRTFILHTSTCAAAMLIPSVTVAAAPQLSEDDPIAVALGYKIDAEQVDITKYLKRAGEEGAKQFCDNCSLYEASDDSGFGTCTAIRGKLVAGAGWCNAWMPKS